MPFKQVIQEKELRVEIFEANQIPLESVNCDW